MRAHLLLGATDRAINLVQRFAGCFHDERRSEYVEHEVATLVGQRVFAIALGYGDLKDHDELRHDPMTAVLAEAIALFYCAFIQPSDPVTLTDTSEKKSRSGLPSATPR